MDTRTPDCKRILELVGAGVPWRPLATAASPHKVETDRYGGSSSFIRIVYHVPCALCYGDGATYVCDGGVVWGDGDDGCMDEMEDWTDGRMGGVEFWRLFQQHGGKGDGMLGSVRKRQCPAASRCVLGILWPASPVHRYTFINRQTD